MLQTHELVLVMSSLQVVYRSFATREEAEEILVDKWNLIRNPDTIRNQALAYDIMMHPNSIQYFFCILILHILCKCYYATMRFLRHGLPLWLGLPFHDSQRSQHLRFVNNPPVSNTKIRKLLVRKCLLPCWRLKIRGFSECVVQGGHLMG